MANEVCYSDHTFDGTQAYTVRCITFPFLDSLSAFAASVDHCVPS